eukprot:4558393-Amphidinium_carterae.1
MGVCIDQPWELDEDLARIIADGFTQEVLEDANKDCPIHLQPGGCFFVSQSVRKGLLPLIIAEVLRLRAAAKER